MKHWASDAIFYHIYPLGFCGAPERNDFSSAPVRRLDKLSGWMDHLSRLGVNALYLGPVFESSRHGYDTTDYYRVDRRLGDNAALSEFSRDIHRRGFRLILDGVFNHVGRDFWAFRDLCENLQNSAYKEWFQGIDFNSDSPYHDPFSYHCWDGHYELVKLNLWHPEVKAHIFQAVAMWIEEFQIDGLRLDVADSLDPGFMKALASFCRAEKPDFWLMGEVIHGDYRGWVNPVMLDSVTNYECYKGLYSSHVDQNYFEIAYSLNRQYGEGGIYRNFPLYNFADNHDVNRVASILHNPAHLYPLYTLLFTMPGVPSIYYGSEWGIKARRENDSDAALRPCLDLEHLQHTSPHPDLVKAIARLAQIRKDSRSLKYGSYRQLFVQAEQMGFLREWHGEKTVVLVNADEEKTPVRAIVDLPDGTILVDLLNPGDWVAVRNGEVSCKLMPCWARVLSIINGST